jgi:hypothetical protein
MDRIGDAYLFVEAGFWNSWAVLVALVVACVALQVEFPLYLRLLVETFFRKHGRVFSPIHINIILYKVKQYDPKR